MPFCRCFGVANAPSPAPLLMVRLRISRGSSRQRCCSPASALADCIMLFY